MNRIIVSSFFTLVPAVVLSLFGCDRSADDPAMELVDGADEAPDAEVSFRDQGNKLKVTIPGMAVTGTNSVRGQWVDPDLEAVFSLFPAIQNGATTGHYAPGAFESTVFDCNSPDDAIIATHPNEGFISSFINPAAYLDPAVIHNTPFADVPITVNYAGDVAPVPFIDDAPNAWSAQRNDQVAGYTLGQYLAANGTMKIKCNYDNDKYSYKIKARDLVPNGLYSFWSNHGPQPPDFDTVAAFGGPTIVTASEEGKIKIKRSLPYCPAEAWVVGLAYHSNMRISGNAPEAPPVLGGAHDHLYFFIKMELDNPGSVEAFDPCP